MFGISATELILILVIALLVLGPERLPEVARQVGGMVRTARQMYNNLRAEMGPEFDEIERGVRELRALDPRQQMRDYSRNLLDNVAAEVPEIKQLDSKKKINLDNAARALLQDEVLDKPFNDNMTKSASNGQQKPSPTPPPSANDSHGHFE